MGGGKEVGDIDPSEFESSFKIVLLIFAVIVVVLLNEVFHLIPEGWPKIIFTLVIVMLLFYFAKVRLTRRWKS